MAAVQPGVWGIDLGQCALKAIRLELIDGEVVATAFDYIEHPKILSQPDADPDQLTRAALEQFLSRNQTKGDIIAISVPGQTGLARFVKLPPVEAKKIPDIVRFEAKQQIPFPLEEVVWDWQTISTVGEGDGFVEHEIGLFAMKRDLVMRYLQAFNDVDVEVHTVQMAPLALCNFVMYDIIGVDADGQPTGDGESGLGERNDCVVTIDIGADSTNLVVTDGQRIIWQRPVPIGGNQFTRALTKDLKLTFAKAEHLKRHATKAEDPKKIFASMKPVFSDFVGELTRSLGFFTNTHRQATIKKLVGLGNAFRLPGLQKFISQSLAMDLEKLKSFRRLKGDEVLKSPIYNENALGFGVAYGLALQGLKVTRLRTNLLPQEIQLDRVVRAKKPWVAAAAASILMGLGIFAISAGSHYEVAAAAAAAADSARSVLDQHRRFEETYQQEQEALRKAREAAVSILRGSQERANWMTVLRYINECLPQPDGTNLPAVYENGRLDPTCPLAVYFATNDAARRAAERLRELNQQGLRDEIDLGDLVQINVQSVWARYCTVPMATSFYNNVKKNAEDQESLQHPDWQTGPPKKEGWAFEVRGYTYHRDALRFVLSTFLENLRTGKPRLDKNGNWVWEKGVIAPLNDPAGKWVKLDISHVAIYRRHTETIASGKTAAFKYITSGLFLNDLVKGSSTTTGAGAGGMSQMQGVGGSSGESSALAGGGAGGGQTAKRDAWRGIGSQPGGSSGAGTTDFGGYPGAASGGGGGGSVQLPGGLSGGGSTTDSYLNRSGTSRPGTRPLKAGDQVRTEFVIVFYWVEPRPTEPEPNAGYEEANSSFDSDMPEGYGNMPEGYGQY